MSEPYPPHGDSSRASFMRARPGTQRHHAITGEWFRPFKLRTKESNPKQHSVIKEFLELGDDSLAIFNFDDGYDNGIYLSNEVHKAGGHPSLSAYSKGLLDKLLTDDIYIELTTGNPTPERATELREMLGHQINDVALKSRFFLSDIYMDVDGDPTTLDRLLVNASDHRLEDSAFWFPGADAKTVVAEHNNWVANTRQLTPEQQQIRDERFHILSQTPQFLQSGGGIDLTLQSRAVAHADNVRAAAAANGVMIDENFNFFKSLLSDPAFASDVISGAPEGSDARKGLEAAFTHALSGKSRNLTRDALEALLGDGAISDFLRDILMPGIDALSDAAYKEILGHIRSFIDGAEDINDAYKSIRDAVSSLPQVDFGIFFSARAGVLELRLGEAIVITARQTYDRSTHPEAFDAFLSDIIFATDAGARAYEGWKAAGNSGLPPLLDQLAGSEAAQQAWADILLDASPEQLAAKGNDGILPPALQDRLARELAVLDPAFAAAFFDGARIARTFEAAPGGGVEDKVVLYVPASANAEGTAPTAEEAAHLFERIEITRTADANGDPVYQEERKLIDRRDIDADVRLSGDIGRVFGSTIGRHLGGGDVLASVVLDATLGTITQNIGEELGLALFDEGGLSSVESFGDAFDDLAANLGGAALGEVSAYLAAELIGSIGIDGVVGDVLQQGVNSSFSKLVSNVMAGAETPAEIFGGVDGSLGQALGSFAGSYLASQTVDFGSIGGQLGASIGSSIGGLVGAKVIGKIVGGALGGPVGAAIGAFAGFLIGGLLGSVFGGTPRSGAEVVWDAESAAFEVGNVWSRKGGSKAAARSLAGAAAETYNGVLAAVGGALLNGKEVRAGSFGLRKKKFTYWEEHSRSKRDIAFRSKDADAVLNYGVYAGLSDMRIAGGDPFAKRAFYGSLALSGSGANFDVQTLLGDLSVAADYSLYFGQTPVVGALIAAEPQSTFAAGWTVTLARAHELGLGRRHWSDWLGGHAYRLGEAGIAAGNASLSLDVDGSRLITIRDADGNVAGFIGDTINAADVDLIEGTAGADAIRLSGAQLLATTATDNVGLTLNGAAHDGLAYAIDVAATVDAGAGDDTVHASDRGDTVLGGTGNDTLWGGALDDWLLGGGGNDTLDAGSAASPGAPGGDGNYLDGGDGNDTLHSREGSDWLEGGAGDDVLVGAGGDDVLAGGAGSDSVTGGAGDDQYIYRAGGGADLIADEGVTYGANAAAGELAQIDVAARIADMTAGLIGRNWAGETPYVERARVSSAGSPAGSLGSASPASADHAAGGRDALVLGPGIGLADIALRRDGEDLLVLIVDAAGVPVPGEEIRLADWTDEFRRVELLRLADGMEIDIGGFASFTLGTAGGDFIVGTNRSDFVHGGSGNDVIELLGGDDVGIGGKGDDFVAGGTGRDIVLGADDDDRIMGGDDADVVTGGRGSDFVYGQSGDDIVAGEAGDDTVVGGFGSDMFRYARGDGRDLVFDAYSANWEILWTSAGGYQNGYYRDPVTLEIKDAGGTVIYDGESWNGQVEYDWEDGILRRHLSNGLTDTGDAGEDTLEFAIGIDIADIQMAAAGDDLVLGIGEENGAGGFAGLTDTVRLKEWLRDWGAGGKPIEQFAFFNTGLLDTGSIAMWGGGGTDGDDVITGGADADWLTGNGGDDVLEGMYGNDILNGNAGQDVLDGGSGDDIVYGGAGDDVLKAGRGDDTLIGGSGNDTVDYSDHQVWTASKIYLETPEFNTEVASGDVYHGIENVTGSKNVDEIYGSAGDNVIEGLGFNDILWGGAGGDTYVYGEGNTNHDTIYEGGFTVDAAGVATLDGSDGGIDTIEFQGALDISDLKPSWEGNDLKFSWSSTLTVKDQKTAAHAVEFVQLADGLTVSLANLQLQAYGESAWRTGTSGDDTIIDRGSGSRTLSGEGGNDVIGAAGGDDTVYGGDGDDHLEGNGGADYLDGGAHTLRDPNDADQALQLGDTARYLSSGAGVAIDLLNGTASGGDATGDTLVNIENLVGSWAHADTLAGDEGGNWLKGLGGDDTLTGRGGDDVLHGGEGADMLDGGAGADALLGGADGDNLIGGAGDDLLYGEEGADTLAGGSGVDLLDGGAGDDGLDGGDGDDRLVALEGSDTLLGGAGNDIYIVGGTGAHSITAGAGHDDIRFEDSAAEDLTFAVAGGDLVVTDAATGLSVTVAGWTSGAHGIRRISAGGFALSKFDLEAPLAGGGTLNWADLESAWQAADGYSDRAVYSGTAGADALAPDANYVGGATFDAGAGDDTVAGTDADDLIDVGAGNDTVLAGAGNDIIEVGVGEGFDDVDGGAGFDIIEAAADNVVVGLRTIGGVERISANGHAGVSVEFDQAALADFTDVELDGIEEIRLSAASDQFTGSAGDDRIVAGDGNDTVAGGAGDDWFVAGSGVDSYDGGGGIDTVDYSPFTGGWTIDLAAGAATRGTVTSPLSAIENAVGGAGADTLIGGAGANRLDGGAGDDTLIGGAGDDVLVSGAGTDSYDGGAGEDTLDFSGENKAVLVDLAGGWAGISGEAAETVSGIEAIIGGDAADNIMGDDAGNRLTGGAGNDTIDGKGGSDTAVFAGLSTDYSVTDNADGTFTVQDLNALDGDEGQDTLRNIRFLAFADTVVDLSPSNVAPEVGTLVPDLAADEDQAFSFTVPADAFTDANGDPLNWSATFADGSPINGSGWLAFDPATRTFSGTPGNGDVGTLSLRLTASDAEYSAEQIFSLEVRNVNDAPEAIAFSGSVSEDAVPGALVGTAAAVDVDAGDTHSYTLIDPSGLFEIDTASGEVRLAAGASLDFETEDAYSVTISATDAAGAVVEQNFVIDVADVNEAPSDIVFTGGAVIDENAPGAVLGALSVADGDRTDVPNGQHDITVSDSRFEVAGGQLKLKDGVALDYESGETSISLTVTATDQNGAGLAVQKQFDFTVNDLIDVIQGGAGNDVLTGDVGADHMFGGAGDDTLSGLGGDDELYGETGDDVLNGDAGDDRLDGGAGGDTLNGGAGADRLFGGFDMDTLDGGAGDDTLDGGEHDDNVYGGAGNDIVRGGGGDDIIYGQDGDDHLFGDGGNDTFGTDVGADTIDGGTGWDELGYWSSVAGVTVDLLAGTGLGGAAEGDVITGIEGIYGSDNHADILKGDDARNVLRGGGGDDELHGRGGDDTLHGGAGNDTIYGGAGIDMLHGDDGDDWLYGEADGDFLYGGAGSDHLYGGTASDTLYGEAGNDFLYAGAAGDHLHGGAGNDELTGGGGNDTYHFDRNSGADTVFNYDADLGSDQISFDQSITKDHLWFQKSGDDVIITVLGTTSQITVKDWYENGIANQDFIINLFVANDWAARDVDVDALIDVMAAHSSTPPNVSTMPAEIQSDVDNIWSGNTAPVISGLADPAARQEDSGQFGVTFTVSDGESAADALQVINITSSNEALIANSAIIVSASGGQRTLLMTPSADQSGTAVIRFEVSDGGIVTEGQFTVTVAAVADAPTLTASSPGGNEGTPIALDISAALSDTDGSESLEVEVRGVPASASLNKGSLQGDGSWLLSAVDLAGLTVTPAADGSGQDLSLEIVARSYDGADTAETVMSNFTIAVNAAPSVGAQTLGVDENLAVGAVVGSVAASDPDTGLDGDLSYSFAGGATSTSDGNFSINASTGQITTAAVLDHETFAGQTYTVEVRDRNGSGAYLADQAALTINVNDVNEAPTLDPGYTPKLYAINEDAAGNAGTTVSQIMLAGAFTDPEGNGLESVAIIGTNTAYGGWQYRLGSGAWQDVGAVSAGSGLLLRASDSLRFQPNANFNGTVTDGITFKAWDQSTGSAGTKVDTSPGGGASAFSTATDTAAITVRAVNDAPTIAPVGNLPSIDEDQFASNGISITDLVAGKVGDVDGTAQAAIAVVGAGSTDGQWQYSLDSGVTWQSLGGASASSARLLAGSNHRIRFVPNTNFSGTPAPLTFRAWDRSAGTIGGTYAISSVGGSSPFSAETRTAGIVVNPVADAPDTPTGTLHSNDFFEGEAKRIATLTRVDADGPTPNLVITGGGTYFEIKNGNEVWSRTNVNYEQQGSSLGVTVVARDAQGNESGAWSRTLTVKDVNEAVTFTDQTATPIAEGGGLNRPVTTLSVSDSDHASELNGKHKFQFVWNDGSLSNISADGRFYVVPLTGEIRTNGGLDYENSGTAHQFSYTLRVWDRQGGSGANWDTAVLTVPIGDINEAPTFPDAPDGHSISGSYSTGWRELGIFSLVDPEGDAVDPTVTITPNIGSAVTLASGEDDGRWMVKHYGSNNFGIQRNILTSTDSGTATFEITPRDVLGVAGTAVTIDASWDIYQSGGPSSQPVALDLDGDGVELISVDVSGTKIDANGDGKKDTIGWIGPDDAWLALDRDGSGKIDRIEEISFVGDLPGATTDLEGLQAYDTNGNGLLEKRDERFGEFLVWQDLDGNGKSSDGELMTLDEAGIEAIELTPTPTGDTVAGATDNVMTGTARFFRSDDTVGQVGDISLAYIDAADGQKKHTGKDKAKGEAALFTPLVVDLDDDGLAQVKLKDGPLFDQDGDGDAGRIGWIGGADAFLVRDLDGDGLAGGADELRLGGGADQGFAALAALDGNEDGRIDAEDSGFASLMLWRDHDGDGEATAAEMSTLADAGLASFALETLGSGKKPDASKNVVNAEALATRTDGSTVTVAEVALAVSADERTDDGGFQSSGFHSQVPLGDAGQFEAFAPAAIFDDEDAMRQFVSGRRDEALRRNGNYDGSINDAAADDSGLPALGSGAARANEDLTQAVERGLDQLVQSMASFGAGGDYMHEGRSGIWVAESGFRSQVFKALERA